MYHCKNKLDVLAACNCSCTKHEHVWGKFWTSHCIILSHLSLCYIHSITSSFSGHSKSNIIVFVGTSFGGELEFKIWAHKQYWQYVISRAYLIIGASRKLASLLYNTSHVDALESTHKMRVRPEAGNWVCPSWKCGCHLNGLWESVIQHLLLAPTKAATCPICKILLPLTLRHPFKIESIFWMLRTTDKWLECFRN